MDKEIYPQIELKFIVNGKQFGETVEIPSRWSLSESETYEKCYVAGHFTQPGRTGYSYNLWLERPLAKDRK